MGTSSLKLKTDKDTLLRRPWLLAAIVISFVSMIFMMVFFYYSDGECYSAWAMELLDCIFRKTKTGFYEYTEMKPRSGSPQIFGCDKTIPMILPLALWDIPLWIVHEITGKMKATDLVDIIWLKTGLALAMFIIARSCARIVKIVKPGADSLLVYPLIFGSFDMLCSVMYAVQDEIVYLMFFVLAMQFFLEKKKKGFLICSAVSVALNPVMLIPIVLLIFLREKNILRILIYLVIIYIPTGLFNILYRSNATYHAHTLMKPSLIRSIFGTDISFARDGGNVSLFLLVICFLAFWAYTKRKEEFKPYDAVWAMALLLMSMTLLSSGGLLNYFYRSLLYVPFLVMLILTSEQDLKTNMVLYLLYSWARGWYCVTDTYPQNMATHSLSFENAFTERLYSKAGFLSLGHFLGKKIPVLDNASVIVSACVALAVVIFYINHSANMGKKYELLNIKPDPLVLVSVLFTPAVLGAFGFMMVSADVFDKELKFGSSFVEYNEEDLGDFCYEENNHIRYYNEQIVYEDNTCLDNGEDIDGERHIYAGGGSFGPYVTLYPGTYRVEVTGEGLQDLTYDCITSNGSELSGIEVSGAEAYEDLIIYTISIEEKTDNIEFRFFNWSEGEIILDSMRISEVKDR